MCFKCLNTEYLLRTATLNSPIMAKQYLNRFLNWIQNFKLSYDTSELWSCGFICEIRSCSTFKYILKTTAWFYEAILKNTHTHGDGLIDVSLISLGVGAAQFTQSDPEARMAAALPDHMTHNVYTESWGRGGGGDSYSIDHDRRLIWIWCSWPMRILSGQTSRIWPSTGQNLGSWINTVNVYGQILGQNRLDLMRCCN